MEKNAIEPILRDVRRLCASAGSSQAKRKKGGPPGRQTLNELQELLYDDSIRRSVRDERPGHPGSDVLHVLRTRSDSRTIIIMLMSIIISFIINMSILILVHPNFHLYHHKHHHLQLWLESGLSQAHHPGNTGAEGISKLRALLGNAETQNRCLPTLLCHLCVPSLLCHLS